MRDSSTRVKQWCDGEMIVRWTTTALREASGEVLLIALTSGLNDMKSVA
jgi:hypothetical protein